MKLIRQRGARDCGVATLAMVASIDYDTAAKLMRDAEPNGGLTWWDINQALGIMGFGVLTWWKASRVFYGERRLVETVGPAPPGGDWPPDPFAPAHYVQRRNHFMAVDADGGVLDPAGSFQGRLEDLDPGVLDSVTGVWKLPLRQRREEARVAALERRLALALPVARAAITETEAESAHPEKPFAVVVPRVDRRRAVDALSPDERAEILEEPKEASHGLG